MYLSHPTSSASTQVTANSGRELVQRLILVMGLNFAPKYNFGLTRKIPPGLPSSTLPTSTSLVSPTWLPLRGTTNTRAPPGFYPTTDSPSRPLNVLCGKCPSGTEKLESGGTRDDCKPCDSRGLFDFDNDASTKCEASKFEVLEFEHYIPSSKHETRYAFSVSKSDPLNNDPLRPVMIGSPDEQQQPPYFGARKARLITSYQTLYADVSVLLPPIRLINVLGNTSSINAISFTVGGVSDDFFINPETGAIFAKPSLPGNGLVTSHNYTAVVHAVDGDGSRAKVETIVFTVIKEDTITPANGPGKHDCRNGDRIDGTKFDGAFTCSCTKTAFEGPNCAMERPCEPDASLDIVDGECKPFQVKVSNQRQRADNAIYTNPKSQQHFAIGTPYQFSPLITTAVIPSTGIDNVGKVQYRAVAQNIIDSTTNNELRSKALPSGFFIKADTGDILVDFRPKDNHLVYNVSIQIEDDGGARVELETLTFSARYRDVDPNNPSFRESGPNNAPCANGGLAVDDEGADGFDGGYTCDCSNIQFSGDNCNVATVCRSNQSFQNGTCVDFVLAINTMIRDHAAGGDTGIVYTNPDTMRLPFYTVNQAYRIAPYTIVDSETSYSSGSRSDIVFTMTTNATGFFLNPKTGEVQGSFAPFDPPTETRYFTLTLTASDEGGARQVVEDYILRVRHPDTASAEYGPGGRMCEHGTPDDAELFDRGFTCNCAAGYLGVACTEVGPHGKPCENSGAAVDAVDFDGKYVCDCSETNGFVGDNCEMPPKSQQTRSISLAGGLAAFALLATIVIYKWCKKCNTKKEATAALHKAQTAYGLPISSKGLNQSTKSQTTINPSFVGIKFLDTADETTGSDNSDEYLEIAGALNEHAESGMPSQNSSYTCDFAESSSEESFDELDLDNMDIVITPPAVQHGQPQPSSKFVAPVMSLGKNTLAAKGLDVLLGVHPKTYMHVKNKVKVIMKEINKSGTEEDKCNLSSIINGTYQNPPNADGTPLTADDISGQSQTIDKLMTSSDVKDAGLERHHVLALRLYTTSSYKSINDPMRQSPPVLPHPFAATLYFISDALSKLREVQGKDPLVHNTTLIFWRGMKNLSITEEFVRTGGTEMACMSTTSSQEVAIDFAKSDSPLLFKFVSKSFMSHGANISFLSVYPGEKEVLYPPLTYLRPIKLSRESVGGKVYQVAEVEPVFPK